jgi:hypothetical protein
LAERYRPVAVAAGGGSPAASMEVIAGIVLQAAIVSAAKLDARASAVLRFTGFAFLST